MANHLPFSKCSCGFLEASLMTLSIMTLAPLTIFGRIIGRRFPVSPARLVKGFSEYNFVSTLGTWFTPDAMTSVMLRMYWWKSDISGSNFTCSPSMTSRITNENYSSVLLSENTGNLRLNLAPVNA